MEKCTWSLSWRPRISSGVVVLDAMFTKKQEQQSGVGGVRPTLRQKLAKDGAPDHWWLVVGGEQATAKTTARARSRCSCLNFFLPLGG
jgi:hypothetical protein